MSIKIKNSKFIKNNVGISVSKDTLLDVEQTEFIDNGEAVKVEDGITSNVHMHAVISKDKKPWYKSWDIIVGIATIIGVPLTLIGLFLNSNGNSYNVSSYNQLGGITVGQIIYQNSQAVFEIVNKDEFMLGTSTVKNVTLRAGEGDLPDKICLKILSDASTISVRHSLNGVSSKTLNNGIACAGGSITREITFYIGLDKKPSYFNIEVVK